MMQLAGSSIRENGEPGKDQKRPESPTRGLQSDLPSSNTSFLEHIGVACEKDVAYEVPAQQYGKPSSLWDQIGRPPHHELPPRNSPRGSSRSTDRRRSRDANADRRKQKQRHVAVDEYNMDGGIVFDDDGSGSEQWGGDVNE